MKTTSAVSGQSIETGSCIVLAWGQGRNPLQEKQWSFIHRQLLAAYYIPGSVLSALHAH